MILPPDQIMKPHLGGGEWAALCVGAILGSLAILAGLANAWFYVRRDPRLEKTSDGRRGALSSAVLGVLFGSYFVWVSMIYILPRAKALSLVEQKEALLIELSTTLPDIDPALFLQYVRVGAVGINDEIDGGTALELYLGVGDTEAARKLLEAGASIDGHSAGQKTPLLSAVDNDDPAAVRFLLAEHANPNLAADHLPIFDAVDPDPDPTPEDPDHPYTGDDGDNPKPTNYKTHHRLEITEALVDAGANLNVQDERAYTPLVIAAATGQCEIVAALLRGHPDLSIGAATRESALDWAKDNHPECAPLLRGTRASEMAAAALLAHTRPEDSGIPVRVRENREARTNTEELRARNLAEGKAMDRKAHPLGIFTGMVGNLFWSMVLSTLLYAYHRIRSFIRGDRQPVHWSWVPVSSNSSSSFDGGTSGSSGSDTPARGGSSAGGGASRDL